MSSREPCSRRRFLQIGGAAALAATVPLGSASVLSGCRSRAGDEFFRGERTIIDQMGRELVIPTVDTLERVYYTSGLAHIFVFTLDPAVQGGTSMQFTPEELKYLPAGIEDLPYMGSMSGGGEIQREELLVHDIQMVFSISGVEFAASDISDANDLENATGIPVVCIDGSFEKIVAAYRFLGDVLGTQERAEEVAAYLEQVYIDVTEALASVKDEDRIPLYYAEGPFGLATEPNVSQHAKTFEVAKARNVAAVELTVGVGMTNVSLESVISWNPEVIIAWDDTIRGGADEIIRTHPDWGQIDAVKNGRVYTMPNAPFAWCDRPPGVNRFLGLQWVANMLYPDLYDVDMVEETKKFYSKLYWVDISDEDALDLLGNSYPPYKKK